LGFGLSTAIFCPKWQKDIRYNGEALFASIKKNKQLQKSRAGAALRITIGVCDCFLLFEINKHSRKYFQNIFT